MLISSLSPERPSQFRHAAAILWRALISNLVNLWQFREWALTTTCRPTTEPIMVSDQHYRIFENSVREFCGILWLERPAGPAAAFGDQ